jgi:arginine/lysine/histidine transporter system substrate-binding protein
MKYLSRLTLLLIVISIALAACASPTPAPTQLPQPTAAPTQVVPVAPTKEPPTVPPATAPTAPTAAPIVAATPEPTAVPTVAMPVRPTGEVWDRIQKAGVLRVATAADYAPFAYYDQNFKIDGYDIALIKEVAKQLNLKVDVNDFAFEGLGGAIANGQADIAIGAISKTPERLELIDFSNVYYAGSDGVLARSDFALEAKTLDAVGQHRLAVQKGSVYESEARQKLVEAGHMAPHNLLVYSDISKAIDDLKAKRVDLVWLDLLPAQNFAASGGIKLLAQDLMPQYYAIGMPQGSTVLQAKINDALAQLRKDGTLTKLAQQYLKLSPDQIKPVSTGATLPAAFSYAAKPPACIDGAQWVADLSYDDQNMTNPPIMQPGQPFTKGWRMLNTGTCSWTTSYKLVYSHGNTPAAQMGGQPIYVTREVKPGETFDFYVNLIAPTTPGTYQGFWTMRNDRNVPFGETVWVGITVPGSPTPTPPPPSQPSQNVTFTANPTSITAGQPVQFNWNVISAQAVYFYHDGQNWQEHGVAGQGSSTEYPQYTLNYYLRVINTDGSATVNTIQIVVQPGANAPVINYFAADPSRLQLTVQCTDLEWETTNTDRIALKVNGQLVWDYAPVNGTYESCPTSVGNWIYRLEAYGPGGMAVQEITVQVDPAP